MAAKKKEGPGFTALQKQLNSELKEEKFRRVYLLCGDQDYLRVQNRDRLKKALLGDGDKMNLCVFTGADTDMTQVIDQADTLPFFADRMVIAGSFQRAPREGTAGETSWPPTWTEHRRPPTL